MSRYDIIQTQKKDKKQVYLQTYYPSIDNSEGDIYIITSYEDRLDLISYDFWGSSEYWWMIATVNNLECDSMYPPIGIQLRIPKNINELLNKYNKENEL